MEQKKEKKEWKTPELIVLVRSKPEEVLLLGCKIPGTSGPNYAPDLRCTNNGGQQPCSAVGTS